MKKRSPAAMILLFLLIACLCGCSAAGAETRAPSSKPAPSVPSVMEIFTKKATYEPMPFVDVHGNEHTAMISSLVPKHEYEKEAFRRDGNTMLYEGKGFRAVQGVDVSRFQGEVDWKQVSEAGYEFAFLRIGFRGYGKEGNLHEDSEYRRNFREARKAGLKVGVYFFAQAVDEKEALEEAEYVLSLLDGEIPDLPVVYDPESIPDSEARTYGISGEQFTKNTRVFCDVIREAGLTPMIYANMMWEAYELQMEKLSDIPVWYADYEPQPQTPYHFEYWQYTDSGTVPGIEGPVDLDVRLAR